ncbi:MAG: threonine ammonia-lyase [Desulfobacterales bacterium]|nr:threonine ammonia-lyase [Desulfobacterales bacterium]
MICLENIKQAAKIISNKIIRTPLVYSPTLSRLFEAEIHLKLENLQKTGSFKIRGANYKLLKSLEDIGPGGVVAASAGNHAQGVALAAKQAGISATIIMPEWASISKQEATRSYGGEVILIGQTLAESLNEARKMTREGKMFIHPYDDPDIITGQGTIALEIFEDIKDVDMIVVPIGGGGLVSGIAVAAKAIKPDVKIVGVQAAVCPSAYESIRNGKLTQVESKKSIADGITVKQLGTLNFAMIKDWVDEVVLVEEEQIAAAILLLLERKKILAEGAGAVSLAAILSGAAKVLRGKKVVLLISGGNLDSPLLERIISQGLLKNGRMMRFGVALEDIPGTLASLLSLMARLKANVRHIYHDRHVRNLPINVIRVELELETRGPAHVEEIAHQLNAYGYAIELR